MGGTVEDSYRNSQSVSLYLFCLLKSPRLRLMGVVVMQACVPSRGDRAKSGA